MPELSSPLFSLACFHNCTGYCLNSWKQPHNHQPFSSSWACCCEVHLCCPFATHFDSCLWKSSAWSLLPFAATKQASGKRGEWQEKNVFLSLKNQCLDLHIRNSVWLAARAAVTPVWWSTLVSLPASAESNVNVSFLQWSFEQVYKGTYQKMGVYVKAFGLWPLTEVSLWRNLSDLSWDKLLFLLKKKKKGGMEGGNISKGSTTYFTIHTLLHKCTFGCVY